MSHVIFASADPLVRQRWRGALNGSARFSTAADREALEAILEQDGLGVVLLHLRLPGIEGEGDVHKLTKAYPQTRFLVLSDRPGEEQGLSYLRCGVHGYCNTFIAPPTLQQAVEVILGGEVWVGWSLMQRLIRGVAPVPEEDLSVDLILPELTQREQEIATLVAQGESNKRVAADLGITEQTVKAHLSTIFRKTGTRDRLQLALLVRERGQGYVEPRVSVNS